MSIFQEIKNAVISGNLLQTKENVAKAVSEGTEVGSILNDGLLAGMSYVGERFKNGESFIPEVLLSARSLHAGLEVIKPLIAKAGIQEKGRVVIGTVKGDLHDIGKNLVIMMLEGNGYKVIDIGIDVPAERFLQAVEEHKPQIVCLSALLTTTLPEMKSVTSLLKPYNDIKVLVGGAPVSEEFADQIGAHGYAPDAASAVDKANELLVS